MTQQDAFALGRSNLNGFLFADIGVERSGMALSVISALARQGLDPWQEAERLAKEPRTVATDGLARLIATMPASLWPLPDATAIAARLVDLLPRQGARDGDAHPAFLSAPGLTAKGRKGGRWLIVAILTMALLAGLAAAFTATPARTAADPAITAAPPQASHPGVRPEVQPSQAGGRVAP